MLLPMEPGERLPAVRGRWGGDMNGTEPGMLDLFTLATIVSILVAMLVG